MRAKRLIVLFFTLMAGCSAFSSPTATPTPTTTFTVTPSPTIIPTETPVPATPTPSITPEPTQTPSPTPPPLPSPTPSNTPQPTSIFTYDNWEFLDLPGDIGARLNSPMIAFLNTNNRTGSGATPQPGNDLTKLYYVSPSNSSARVEIKQFDASTGDQIYIAPTGDAFAYMRYNAGTSANGLYIADFEVGISGRVLPLASLNQRGIFNAPSWHPDGSLIAIALVTGYDIDIYTIDRGGAWAALVTQGSYDFWPVWSPDGSNLAFVSDRVLCPSWRPGETGTCDGTNTATPAGGHVFVLEVGTGRVTQISNEIVYEPPRWATPRQITFAVGDPLFGDPERSLHIADIYSGEDRIVQLSPNDLPLKLAESWSPSGQQVIFQAASDTTTSIILAQANGTEVGRLADLTFSRYGMSAVWSPDGSRLAIGGVGGQCPHGVIVTDSALGFIARGNPPPTMCEPTFSPDGTWLAFTGVIPNRDGRVDVYTASVNGFGAVNLTGSLLGNIDMIGWVGGR